MTKKDFRGLAVKVEPDYDDKDEIINEKNRLIKSLERQLINKDKLLDTYRRRLAEQNE